MSFGLRWTIWMCSGSGKDKWNILFGYVKSGVCAHSLLLVALSAKHHNLLGSCIFVRGVSSFQHVIQRMTCCSFCGILVEESTPDAAWHF